MAKQPTIQRDGQYWLSLARAAKLLGTTHAKVRAMVEAGELKALGSTGYDYVDAEFVTRLRAKRGRVAVEVERRASPETKREFARSHETRLYEGRKEQRTLPWGRND